MLVALVLHQPVQLVVDLPVDGGGQQGALAGHAVAKAVLVFLGQVEAHLYLLTRFTVEVGGQSTAVKAADPGGDAGGLPLLGRLADPVDDAAGAATAVEHCRRPLEHFDPLGVAKVAGVLHVVAKAVQIEVVAGAEAADVDPVEAGVSAGVDAGDAGQGLAQGGLAEGGQLARLDAVDGLRHQLGRGVGAGRGGDLFMLAAFADHCHGLVFGVCAGAQGQQGDTQQSARVVRCVHVAC